ncbi:MAG: SRPBCC family protein [Solirubrobacterales bacterium]
MARVVRRRRIAAPASALWAVITDPYHLPRWWPLTQRVENVTGGEPTERSWTQVLETRDGRGVRADYVTVSAADGERYVFEQTIEGTPFERFVKHARTEIALKPEDGETEVTMALDRRMRGLSRLGSPMMRRAIGRTLNEALSGLEEIATGSAGGEPA